jgi:hypothetical protein
MPTGWQAPSRVKELKDLGQDHVVEGLGRQAPRNVQVDVQIRFRIAAVDIDDEWVHLGPEAAGIARVLDLQDIPADPLGVFTLKSLDIVAVNRCSRS